MFFSHAILDIKADLLFEFIKLLLFPFTPGMSQDPYIASKAEQDITGLLYPFPFVFRGQEFLSYGSGIVLFNFLSLWCI